MAAIGSKEFCLVIMGVLIIGMLAGYAVHEGIDGVVLATGFGGITGMISGAVGFRVGRQNQKTIGGV